MLCFLVKNYLYSQRVGKVWEKVYGQSGTKEDAPHGQQLRQTFIHISFVDFRFGDEELRHGRVEEGVNDLFVGPLRFKTYLLFCWFRRFDWEVRLVGPSLGRLWQEFCWRFWPLWTVCLFLSFLINPNYNFSFTLSIFSNILFINFILSKDYLKSIRIWLKLMNFTKLKIYLFVAISLVSQQ